MCVLNEQGGFVIDPKSEKQLMQNAATCFRTFKYHLTKHIKKFEHEPEKLATPPELYSHINKDDWDAFVKSRLSKEFQVHMISFNRKTISFCFEFYL